MNTYQLINLKGKALRTFLAIAARIIPEDENSESAGNIKTAAVVDWTLQKIPSDIRKKIVLFLKVINVLTFFKYFKSFEKLSDEKQDSFLRWLESHKISLFRMGFFGIKTYVCMGYYTREEMWDSIDYDGPILKSRSYPDAITRELSLGTATIIE